MEQTTVPIQKTILIADDDPSVLKVVSKILTQAKYQVLASSSGADALRVSQEHNGEIHLLLSDFEMPGMTGVDLATQITAERPQIKVLLMSGFDAGMLILNEGWHFLPKPFIPSQLTALINGLISTQTNSKYAA